MSIELMREFSVLGMTSSLSEASRMLHVSQPTLSRHLESLESIVGVKLIDRSNAGVSLTPAGNAFLEDTLEMLASFDRAIERAKEHLDGFFQEYNTRMTEKINEEMERIVRHGEERKALIAQDNERRKDEETRKNEKTLKNLVNVSLNQVK